MVGKGGGGFGGFRGFENLEVLKFQVNWECKIDCI